MVTLSKPGIERVQACILANILRSLFVARTPSEEARSPGRRSNVENAPPSPASQRPAARADPAQPAVRTMPSYRGMDARL